MDICSALPERTLLSCYEYCRRHFHEGNYKGAWTDEEVTRLRRLQSQYGNTWKVIAEELRRERTNVRDKWRELEMPGRVTGAWSDEENAQLLKLISDACSADVQLMGSEGAIPWAVIAAQMGRRSAKQCRTAWKRLSQTAGSGLPGSEMDAFDFVSALYHSAVRDPSEVTWENFGRNAHRRFQLLCKSVDSGDAAPFRARVIALYRSFESPTAGDGGGGDESS
ncbi:hypothetical protein T492DRAFT_1097533 [Pavlovales sp. CCMP2436]|nr:hypothetical protein T492DRAFT_1097533 [Pavlovales sp. CCMP2436]